MFDPPTMEPLLNNDGMRLVWSIYRVSEPMRVDLAGLVQTWCKPR